MQEKIATFLLKFLLRVERVYSCMHLALQCPCNRLIHVRFYVRSELKNKIQQEPIRCQSKEKARAIGSCKQSTRNHRISIYYLIRFKCNLLLYCFGVLDKIRTKHPDKPILSKTKTTGHYTFQAVCTTLYMYLCGFECVHACV